MTTDNPNDKDTHLKDAIENIGGVEVKKPVGWDNTKSINTVLGINIRFFPEYPKKDWNELVGTIFRILAIRIIVDWDDTKYGKSSFPLLLIDLEDGCKFTTLGAGIAILNQSKKLLNLKCLPVKVKLVLRPSEQPANQPYYFMEGTK